VRGIFLVHHMKRSGGHAVVNWLMDHDPRAAFVNNDIPLQPILEGRRTVPDGTVPYSDWLARKLRRPEHAGLANADTVLVSLEDHELHVKPFAHPSARVVVILRAPESLFASRIRKASHSPLWAYDYRRSDLLTRGVTVWQEHARAALGTARGNGPVMAVFYDAWLTSPAYRATLARDFGVGAQRDPSGVPATEGQGSSFGEADFTRTGLLNRADLLNGAERQVLASVMTYPGMTELARLVQDRVSALQALS
jgi:hypothetical protein